MTEKLINDLGFVLLGILISFGIYSEQFQNQWVVLLFSNVLISFFFIHYKPQSTTLFNWMGNSLTKENNSNSKMKNSNLVADNKGLPPIPELKNNKLENIKQKYNIDPNVDYNKDDSEETVNNVIPLLRVSNQSEEMTQLDVDSFIKESQKVVKLDDYRRRKTGGFNPPTQGA